MEHLAHVGDPALLGPALAWFESSGLGTLARQSLWLYPLVSVLHILGVALLLGSIVVFDLRVLGAVPSLPLTSAVRLMLPVAAFGVLLQAASGLVMFAADATHLARNPIFVAKLALVAAALLNVLVFHLSAGRGMARLTRPGRVPAWARITAILSLCGWTAAAALGRIIAYV